MRAIDRREFIKISTAASAGLVLSACGRGRISPFADLVIHNGRIITVDKEDSIVNAVAVKDGLIDFIGTGDEIQEFIGPDTAVIDLDGKTATPGLVDSHIHVIQYGKQNWDGFTNIRFPDVSSRDDLIRVLNDAVAQKKDGEWISGNKGFLLSLADAPVR